MLVSEFSPTLAVQPVHCKKTSFIEKYSKGRIYFCQDLAEWGDDQTRIAIQRRNYMTKR